LHLVLQSPACETESNSGQNKILRFANRRPPTGDGQGVVSDAQPTRLLRQSISGTGRFSVFESITDCIRSSHHSALALLPAGHAPIRLAARTRNPAAFPFSVGFAPEWPVRSTQNPQRVPSTRHTEHSWLPERFVSLPPKTPRSPRFFFAAHPCTKGRAHAAAVKGKVPVGNAYARMGGHAQVGTEALQGAPTHGRIDRSIDRSTDRWTDKRAHGQMDASPPSVPLSETTTRAKRRRVEATEVGRRTTV
jgi:hypothetical protein